MLPPETNRLRPDRLPTPFSAGEIRAACAPGRRNLFRIESSGEPAVLDDWRFVGTDPDEAEMVHRRGRDDGTPLGAPEPGRAPWTALQAHASFPVATTTISEGTVVTPAGSFAAWCYAVAGGDGSSTRFWFARELPGPPVLVITERDGAVTYRSELVEYDDPRRTW